MKTIVHAKRCEEGDKHPLRYIPLWKACMAQYLTWLLSPFKQNKRGLLRSFLCPAAPSITMVRYIPLHKACMAQYVEGCFLLPNKINKGLWSFLCPAQPSITMAMVIKHQETKRKQSEYFCFSLVIWVFGLQLSPTNFTCSHLNLISGDAYSYAAIGSHALPVCPTCCQHVLVRVVTLYPIL